MDQLVAAAIAEQRRDLLGLAPADPARPRRRRRTDPWRCRCRRDRARSPRRRARTRPRWRARRPAAGCRRGAAHARRPSMRSTPIAASAPAIHSLRAWRGVARARKRVTPPSASAPAAARQSPGAMITAQPARVAIRAATSLLSMPPVPAAGACAAGHGLDLRDLGDSRAAPRRIARIGGIQTVHIRQEDQLIGARHDRDARRQPVVVAKTDLVGRDRVVLVDHRHHAELEQRLDRGARVQ